MDIVMALTFFFSNPINTSVNYLMKFFDFASSKLFYLRCDFFYMLLYLLNIHVTHMFYFCFDLFFKHEIIKLKYFGIVFD